MKALCRAQEALHANTTGLPYPYDVCGIRGLEYDRQALRTLDRLLCLCSEWQLLSVRESLRYGLLHSFPAYVALY